MNRFSKTSILAICLLFAACGGGGGDDSAGVNAPGLIAEIVRVHNFGASRISETVFPALEVGPGSNSPTDALLWGSRPVTQDNLLTVLEADASHADWDGIVTALTNGTPDPIDVRVRLDAPITSVQGDGGDETRLFGPYIAPGAVDFAAFRITRITYEIKSMSTSSPGRDVNGDGNWTDVYMIAVLRVFGTPR